MVGVWENTKNSYLTDCHYKRLEVGVDVYTFDQDLIIEESMKLNQAIMNSESLELGGCIASYFEVKIRTDFENLTGKPLDATIKTETNEEIHLFTGIIDDVTCNTANFTSKVIGYDAFYKASGMDITEWYNNHAVTTIGALFNELLSKIGISAVDGFELPCGNLTAFCGTVKKVEENTTALDLLKDICVLCGGFGFINGEGKFCIKYINGNPDLLPDIVIDDYRYCDFADYKVKAFEKVVIRDSESDENSVAAGNGNNIYYIQGNRFIYGQSKDTRQSLCNIIYALNEYTTFTPFEAAGPGLPFVEVGDRIAYKKINASTKSRKFFVLNRQLTGIQLLVDKYSADATEQILPKQSTTSSTSSQIESIKDEMLDAVSVDVVPEDWKPKTIYFIRKK